MTSQEDNLKPTVDRTLTSSDTSSSSTKVTSKEPLKFNFKEFKELKELETANDTVGVEELKKRVRRRMEAESALAKQQKSTTASSSKSNTGDNLVNQKRPAATTSTSKTSDNVMSNKDKKVPVKRERTITASKSLPVIKKEKQPDANQRKSKSLSSVSRGATGNSVVNKGKEAVASKAKPSSFTSTPKSIDRNSVINKMKQIASTHQKKQPSSTPTLKRTSASLIDNKDKHKRAVDYQEKVTSSSLISNGKLHTNNGKQAAVNHEKVRNTLPSASSSSTSIKSAKRGLQIKERLIEEKKSKERLMEERKRKYQQKLEEERKLEKRRHQSAVETKRRQENSVQERRRLEKLNEEKRRQKASTVAESQRRHKRVTEGDLRPGHSNVQTKRMTNRSEMLTSTSHRKRTFDEHSDLSPSSRVQKVQKTQKRRNTRDGGDFDIYRLDETTLKQNMSSIIHSLMRPGRRPIHGIVDDNDDDIMEVSGLEVLREEARSSRLAKKEDEEEERLEQQRRVRKHKDKKFSR